MACFKQVKKKKIFFKLKLTTRKIFDYKDTFFLFYVAKYICYEIIIVLKISTFAAKLIFL